MRPGLRVKSHNGKVIYSGMLCEVLAATTPGVVTGHNEPG